MRKVGVVEGIAVVYDVRNVDTDQICPARFLHTPRSSGYGDKFFRDFRFDQNGQESDFIFNKTPFDKARVLVCGDNFGCGSSREQAVWALADFGIEALIAPKFGDIFRGNCTKNGILPIVVEPAVLDDIKNALQKTPQLRIDLSRQVVEAGKLRWNFEMDSFSRNRLISGLGEIADTMKEVSAIQVFEKDYAKSYPWMHT